MNPKKSFFTYDKVANFVSMSIGSLVTGLTYVRTKSYKTAGLAGGVTAATIRAGFMALEKLFTK